MKQIPLNTGDRFGKLTVVTLDHTQLYFHPTAQTKQTIEYYLCICDCGRTRIVCKDHLKKGETRSCGCLVHEKRPNRSKRHA